MKCSTLTQSALKADTAAMLKLVALAEEKLCHCGGDSSPWNFANISSAEVKSCGNEAQMRSPTTYGIPRSTFPHKCAYRQ